ncbi:MULTISPECIES: type I-B CRISPR-associated protein Cas5b [Bacillus cereus group]|uniref:type I-B CRISPR-associated protein Cas5b n=1 Tax=Bacillus cereus group TaxID=86661 RepID=UPI0006612A6C|nr:MULTISPECIES: type I-B CRISPR-associated protein Cas5b [Bacillus cereus group]AWC32688.1 type I-B CRISPR-associated protein Cas5 [Bacillus cytotoxicus]AWC36717.1 type I-B CRISPR-associated protein Cas5 [Bacillus cytotoxicus]AWC60973.1 type I-B CRISPR-associated protein Cas5 [Bacillus cytotoxicus]KMT51155.1 CRISPR-associated protein Cas5 [Bacillus cytotoxicus]MDH2888349.1 type I-B CRISPR-associated protein Cas5b [Bacillus cytotoxicus]
MSANAALRVDLYQQTACYKKPMAQKAKETYPLPPYSTVKGFLHYVLGANELIPMEISIQGTHEGKLFDLQTHYFYKSNEITTMPTHVHMLKEVSLIFHVLAEQHVLEKLQTALKNINEAPHLGRREDLAVIEDVKIVTLKERHTNKIITLKNDFYIPRHCIVDRLDYMNYKGISYRLNTVYQVKQGIRTWETVQTQFFRKGEGLNSPQYMEDEDGHLVFFHAL